jgi:prepilin-type N-terminal cleavage/methylation domain-containing protein
MKNNRNQSGFSLVEMAIVTAILGIVFAGYMVGFGSFHHSSSMKLSQSNQTNIKKQILNFGMINKYLPCPDTNGDGLENRPAFVSGTFQVCDLVLGTVPYLDIGLEKEDVDDGWGNPIRYAVNTETVNASSICDNTKAASMFCNAGSASGIFWFNIIDTPPTAVERGVGNYYVCNKSAVNCSTTATYSELETDTAVIVLVAYNDDGATTINSMPGCSGIPAQNVDNCNADNVYHQRGITLDDAHFFDDVVTSISGYEVKASLLSKSISWNSYEITAPPTPLVPTYSNFDISSDEYDADQDQIETTGDDVILVNRDVSTALNLGAGDDYIAIGNDLNASLNTGDDNDTVYIVGAASGDVLLGDGDDQFVLGSDLTNSLDAGTGNDKVWIQGNIESGSSLLLGDDNDVLWVGLSTAPSTTGSINESIDGGSGQDILVLENYASEEEFWAASPSQNDNVDNFEYIIFADDGSGNRSYCTWGVDCDGTNN